MNPTVAQAASDLKPLNALVHNILTFIYFLAHQTGLWVVKILQAAFPRTAFPEGVVDAIGFLSILTLFMFLVSVAAAKKITWIVVCAGWILILVRILMAVFKMG